MDCSLHLLAFGGAQGSLAGWRNASTPTNPGALERGSSTATFSEVIPTALRHLDMYTVETALSPASSSLAQPKLWRLTLLLNLEPN